MTGGVDDPASLACGPVLGSAHDRICGPREFLRRRLSNSAGGARASAHPSSGARTASDAARYFGFVWPSRSHIALGVAAVIAFIVLGDAVTWAFGRNVVTGFQNDIYRTAAKAGWLPWLWLVVVVVTPFGEETLFRGFLFRGWHRTPGDAWAVILITAALFAIVHVQYDLFVIAQVFVCGVMLGWFRWASGSTILTMLLHGLINFEGMVETFVAFHR